MPTAGAIAGRCGKSRRCISRYNGELLFSLYQSKRLNRYDAVQGRRSRCCGGFGLGERSMAIERFHEDDKMSKYVIHNGIVYFSG